MAQAAVISIVSGKSLINYRAPFLASRIRCSSSNDDNDTRKEVNKKNSLAVRVLLSTVAAGILLASPVADNNHIASAAQSGGRIGGQSFRSAPPRVSPPRRSAPPPRSGPRINNSRTNIYVNPGYGYGYGNPFFGGGFSPFSYFYAPAVPSVAVGAGGFDFIPVILGLAVLGWVARAFRKRQDRDDDYYD